jgi:hypothetical protein
MEESQIEEHQDDAPTPEEVEAQKAAEEEARKYGWRSRDEFDREPAGWVDADRFLELPQTHVKMFRDENEALKGELGGVKEQLERIGSVQREAVRIARDQERQRYEEELTQITQQQRRAVEEANPEAFDALEQQKQDMQKRAPLPEQQQPDVDPAVVKYHQDNEWAQNPVLWREAVEAIEHLPPDRRGTAEQQLEFAEKTMRLKYPHMFQEKQLAQPQASKVDGGGLGLGRKMGKGVNDLPSDAQKVAREMVEDGIFKSVDDYAKAYWEQG